ncbi:hypothetical protein AmaxDRAFT_0005 [Limnospira maxima CS-328]|uniref:Uncharacterized protein n=1 Tax=Limnospira maxima CS-328 TaxID=513049 RepID=B5VUM4_LIMMA|nr:hypothetical protein AmaxDRAFT_0005 [Limnospira maxima CS-328]UWU50760.1 hypothetical protein APLC1_5702 [Arthrospira platensis C1]
MPTSHGVDIETAVSRSPTAKARLGVESEVTFIPSHSEPCMKVSLHTAPSLIVPLLRIQRWRCQMPFYHHDSGGVIAEGFYIRPFHRGFEV